MCFAYLRDWQAGWRSSPATNGSFSCSEVWLPLLCLISPLCDFHIFARIFDLLISQACSQHFCEFYLRDWQA